MNFRIENGELQDDKGNPICVEDLINDHVRTGGKVEREIKETKVIERISGASSESIKKCEVIKFSY